MVGSIIIKRRGKSTRGQKRVAKLLRPTTIYRRRNSSITPVIAWRCGRKELNKEKERPSRWLLISFDEKTQDAKNEEGSINVLSPFWTAFIIVGRETFLKRKIKYFPLGSLIASVRTKRSIGQFGNMIRLSTRMEALLFNNYGNHCGSGDTGNETAMDAIDLYGWQRSAFTSFSIKKIKFSIFL